MWSIDLVVSGIQCRIQQIWCKFSVSGARAARIDWTIILTNFLYGVPKDLNVYTRIHNEDNNRVQNITVLLDCLQKDKTKIRSLKNYIDRLQKDETKSAFRILTTFSKMSKSAFRMTLTTFRKTRLIEQSEWPWPPSEWCWLPSEWCWCCACFHACFVRLLDIRTNSHGNSSIHSDSDSHTATHSHKFIHACFINNLTGSKYDKENDITQVNK